MAKPYEISLVSNTRALNADLKKSADAVDGISDALDDVAREGDDTSEKLERSFRDAARAAKKSGDDVGRGFDRGFDRAKEGSDEFKRESESTAKEAAASFDGSAESIGDAFQEVAANAFAGFGPAGAVAGVAAAAGLGVAMEAITAQQEAADELKRRLTDAYLAAAEEGRNYLSVQQIIEESGAIYADAERLAIATEDAAKFNLDRQLVVQAMAGDEEAINAVIAAGNDLVDEGTEKMREKADAGKNVIDIETAQTAGLEQIVAKYQSQLDLQKTIKSNSEEYLDLVDEQSAKEQANQSRAMTALEKRSAALEAFYKKAANPPSPVITPRVDDSALTRIEQRVRALDGRSIAIRIEGQTGAGRFVL